MSEPRKDSRPWEPEDEIEAVRLESMRQLAEQAQLTALGPNVKLIRSPNGGTAISVDPAAVTPSPLPPVRGLYKTLVALGDGTSANTPKHWTPDYLRFPPRITPIA